MKSPSKSPFSKSPFSKSILRKSPLKVRSKPRLVEYRIVEGSRGTMYRFAEVLVNPKISLLITGRSSARKTLSTPISTGASAGETGASRERIAIVTILDDAAYDAVVGKFPKGKVTLNALGSRHTDISRVTSADDVAAAYLRQTGIGADVLANRMAQGLARVADGAGEAVGGVETGVGGLAGLTSGFAWAGGHSTLTGTSYAIGLTELAGSTIGVGVVVALAGGLGIGVGIDATYSALAGDSIGGDIADAVVGDLDASGVPKTGPSKVFEVNEAGEGKVTYTDPDGNVTITLYDAEGNVTKIVYVAAGESAVTVYDIDDTGNTEEATGTEDNSGDEDSDSDDEDTTDNDTSSGGNDDEDTTDDDDEEDTDDDEDTDDVLPSEPGSDPLPQRVLDFINLITKLPGAWHGYRGPYQDVTSPLILTTGESTLRGGNSGKLSIRLERVTNPSDDPASGGSGSATGSGRPRMPGFGVIDYVEEHYPGVVPSVLGSRDPTGPDTWECPWIFIPGGDCGYYYCPYERNPLTGEPIRQLIPAECSV